MTSESIFVFVEMNGKPVIAGRLSIVQTDKGRLGSFVYGKSWLTRKEAFPLDPINLPLEERVFSTPNENYILGVFNDAAPDLWGRRTIEVLDPTPAPTDFKYLIRGSGQGVGALLFAKTQHLTDIPKLSEEKSLNNLPLMQEGAEQIAQHKTLSHHLARFLEGGLSMGGARPKTVLFHEGREWIAKFSNPDDIYDIQKAESASLSMAQDLGIRTPAHFIVETERGSVLLVERFDRDNQGRKHYISAHSLLNVPLRVHQSHYYERASYLRIADLVSKLSSESQNDRTELFKRMVFNIAIGNADDHLKNHGFLKNRHNHHYRLSPVFDVLTQPHTSLERVQALVVGKQGALATYENALSECGRFGLSPPEAFTIIEETSRIVNLRNDYYKKAQLSEADIYQLNERIEKRMAFMRPEQELSLDTPHTQIEDSSLDP